MTEMGRNRYAKRKGAAAKKPHWAHPHLVAVNDGKTDGTGRAAADGWQFIQVLEEGWTTTMEKQHKSQQTSTYGEHKETTQFYQTIYYKVKFQ